MEQPKPAHDEMFCTTCGKIIKNQAEICIHCGVRVKAKSVAVSDPNVQYSEKSRIAAGVFGILLGGIGVHSFYLGKSGKGILQIVVTLITLGIGGLWGFIEGIIIIAGGKTVDGQGKPLKPNGAS